MDVLDLCFANWETMVNGSQKRSRWKMRDPGHPAIYLFSPQQQKLSSAGLLGHLGTCVAYDDGAVQSDTERAACDCDCGPIFDLGGGAMDPWPQWTAASLLRAATRRVCCSSSHSQAASVCGSVGGGTPRGFHTSGRLPAAPAYGGGERKCRGSIRTCQDEAAIVGCMKD